MARVFVCGEKAQVPMHGRKREQSSAARHTIVVVRGPNGDHAAGTQSGDAPPKAHQLRWVLRILKVLVTDRRRRGSRRGWSHPRSDGPARVV